MLEAGLFVSVNSDDPPYFGGYIADNYTSAARLWACRRGLHVARNSLTACFLPAADIADAVACLDAASRTQLPPSDLSPSPSLRPASLRTSPSSLRNVPVIPAKAGTHSP